MNTVYSRQNTDIALECQTSARFYYNRADLLDNFYWLGILITIVSKVIWKNSIWVDYSLILWFIATIVLDNYISQYTSKASEFKQIFDEFVFGWRKEISPNTIKAMHILKENHKNFFNIQISHTGNDKPRGVKDWYEFVDDKENQQITLKKAIGESIYYDTSINSILIVLLVISSSLTLLYFRDATITEYLKTVFLVMSSLSKKIITTFLKTLRVNKLNKEIKLRLDLAKNEDDFKEIQNIVFIKRQVSGVTPRWIYLIKKNKITKLAKIFFSNID
ncbi:Uncharacterised protein [Enterococcus casseliflavus]|uniref:S-4TM family putative pore-forming effector n=2 Tax=Enterococcus casseliflavus TaxID=37734 RepID=UPI000E078AAB|nr:S-4TM family putative pore-forming effector [Enterococcus casseliflavus]GEB30063.1 hypothetical protein ECA02_31580 [Enterococcus casseliflavus]STP37378.1 Uncharacterised protein [Enterococcus casseliflavus]